MACPFGVCGLPRKNCISIDKSSGGTLYILYYFVYVYVVIISCLFVYGKSCCLRLLQTCLLLYRFLRSCLSRFNRFAFACASSTDSSSPLVRMESSYALRCWTICELPAI